MERQIKKVLISRLSKCRSVALLGARQVGKSYLLRDILKDHPGKIISFDDPLERNEASRDPVKYLERYYEDGKFLFIDEAAKVPEIFSAVKIIVDRKGSSPSGICLANSGNYLLMQKIRESLAGRTSLLSMFPVSWREFTSDGTTPGLIGLSQGKIPDEVEINLSLSSKRMREDRLMWGGYPEPSLSSDVERRVSWAKDYLMTYVLPLIVEQFNIRDIHAFESLSRIMLLSGGQFVNYNKAAQISGISQPTAMSYVKYLEAMMVIKIAPIYFRNNSKRLVKHPKIFVLDTLLMNESLGNNFSMRSSLERGDIGRIYENFIFAEILKTLSNHDISAESFTWRTHDGAEVDVVLSVSGNLIPIEIKWSEKITSQTGSGLDSFMKSHPETKQGYVVYPGTSLKRVSDKVTAIPDSWLLGSMQQLSGSSD